MIPSYEQVGDWLEEISAGFPDAFFDQLDGGIQLEEEALPDPEFPLGEMYIMGSTVTTCWAVHRSVLRLLRRSAGGGGRGDLEGRTFATVAHEFTPPHGGDRRAPRSGRSGRGVPSPGPGGVWRPALRVRRASMPVSYKK